MSWDNIPAELKEHKSWVCWKLTDRQGKPTKTPYNARTGKMASSTAPITWTTFDEAIFGVKRFAMDGIGYVFSGNGYVGVDIDACRDPETGVLSPEAQEIVGLLDSYTEFSQSGKGLHVICKGKLLGEGRRRGKYEMYDVDRYFVMTGFLFDDAHTVIEERQDELTVIHQKYVAAEEKRPVERRPSEPMDIDDSDLLRMAMAANNGSLFSRLWNGDISGHQSHSEADLALCNLLAFWTGRDEGRMISLWRQSGLWREKCDERHGARTYAEITASKAAADTAKTYSPKDDRPRRKEVQPPPGMSWDEPPVFEPSEEYAEQLPEIRHESSSPTVANLFDSTHDVGRARRFANQIKGWALWCGDFDSWLIWNGKTWQRDRTLQIISWAKQAIEQMVDEAIKHHWKVRTKDSEDLMKKVMGARSDRSIRAMLSLTKDELACTADQFDSDPYLLNCQTGIVDIRDGQQYPHDPAAMMTKCAGAGYYPGTQWTMFGEFLDLITCGDTELVKYFQDVCGISAIGKVMYEGMAIFFGAGQNGKSTFTNCINKVFGDYGGTISAEALINQRESRQLPGGLSVMGKRLVIAQELEEGRKLSSSALKKLASTDPITERPLYENERTFLPSHTLIMATNFLPRVGSTDMGTWRRIMVVPFNACIPAGNQVKDYADLMYQADKDAILAWIIEGAIRQVKNGCHIKIPNCVASMTDKYKNAEDWLANFLDECCDVGRYSMPGGELYEAYERWCEGNNEHPRRARDFTAALEARGFEKRKTMTGNMWDGVKVNKNYAIDKFAGYQTTFRNTHE